MWKIQYRVNGEWYNLNSKTYKTKKLAREEALQSRCCELNGYQIIKSRG